MSTELPESLQIANKSYSSHDKEKRLHVISDQFSVHVSLQYTVYDNILVMLVLRASTLELLSSRHFEAKNSEATALILKISLGHLSCM